MANTQEDPTLTTLIATYQEANEEYKKAQDRRQKAKTMARGLVDIGIGSDEQIAWVNEHLPKVSRQRKESENAE